MKCTFFLYFIGTEFFGIVIAFFIRRLLFSRIFGTWCVFVLKFAFRIWL